MKSNCINCQHWNRSDDKIIGFCVVLQAWRFQLEGGMKDCPSYVFGEERKPVHESVQVEVPEVLSVEDQIAVMLERGDNLTAIREALHVGNKRIINIANARGIEVIYPEPYKPFKIDEANIPRIARMRADGISLYWIGKQFGVSKTAVSTALAKVGLK